MSAMHHLLRANKIANLCKVLSPAPTGSIDDLARASAFVFHPESPIDAPFDVERPVHVVLNDIGRNVVEFMTGAKDTVQDRTLDSPPGMDAYILSSYPMVLTLSLRLIVEHPKVAVTVIDGKGKGVVATSNISANTIVTFYPVDLVRVRCYENTSTITGGMSSFFTPHKHFRDAENKIGRISHRLDD